MTCTLFTKGYIGAESEFTCKHCLSLIVNMCLCFIINNNDAIHVLIWSILTSAYFTKFHNPNQSWNSFNDRFYYLNYMHNYNFIISITNIDVHFYFQTSCAKQTNTPNNIKYILQQFYSCFGVRKLTTSDNKYLYVV